MWKVQLGYLAMHCFFVFVRTSSQVEKLIEGNEYDTHVRPYEKGNLLSTQGIYTE